MMRMTLAVVGAVGLASGCGGGRASDARRSEVKTPVATDLAPTPVMPTPADPIAAPTEPAPEPPVVAVAPPTPPPGFPADCSVTPPSQADHDVLWATASDAKPEILDGVRPEKFGQHYYVSDEGHGDRFRDHIANSGGGYIGIGSDQAYLYIGWARPQFAWTVDYDIAVVEMHQIQQAFILAADTPAAYRALWARDHDAQARAIVTALTSDRRQQRNLLSTLGQGQPRMRRRLGRLDRNMDQVPTYLTDQATYDFLRNLIRNGCMRPMLVDLTADQGMVGIGAAAAKVGLPIRTVYLSNAEEYWSYTDQFRTNIRALIGDEHSVVLHTQSSNVNHDYRYTVQPLANFVTWLDDGWAHSVDMMLGRITVKSATEFPITRFELTPDEGRAARAKRHRAHK
jgi:hypothetical protein